MIAGLFLALVLAKGIVLWGRGVPVSLTTAAAYFWHDAAIALVAGVLAMLPIASNRVLSIGRAGYTLLVAYVAINVPVMLVLATPLTLPMLHGARGALADSIRFYLTVPNLAAIVAVAGVGLTAPVWVRSARRAALVTIVVAIGMLVAGLWAHARVDTRGLERNAVTALIPVKLTGLAASAASGRDWRAADVDPRMATVDLSGLRGTARHFNVVTIVLESTAAQYLQPYGATSDPMPVLGALSRRALLFDHAYAVYPESVKGLFSTLCSRYPAFGVEAEAHAGAPCASAATLLKQAGYHTALFHSGRFRYLGMQELIANKGFDTLADAGAIGGNEQSSFGVDEPSTVEAILRWIDTVPRRDRFFVEYLPAAGHHPYATSAPGPFPSNTEASQYLNALHEADAALGTLIAGLAARGLDRDTMVIVFGDHGEAFEQHPGNAGHTFFIYDENVHVPLMIAIPGATETASRTPAVTSLIDVTPTMLDLLGLPGSPLHEGVSALRPVPQSALLFSDYSLGWLGLREGCWKFMEEVSARRPSLFDICRDGSETTDLAASQPDRVARYRGTVEDWAKVVRGRFK